MTISTNSFDKPKAVTLHWTPDGRLTPGLFITTGVAIIDFRGASSDWTRDDLEFIVPTIPTIDPDSGSPVVILDCNAILYPATIEVSDQVLQTWFGWGVDSTQALVTGNFPGQNVTVKARVVAKSIPSIMIRVGFSVHTVWIPAATL